MTRWTWVMLLACTIGAIPTSSSAEVFGELLSRIVPRSFLPGRAEPGIAAMLLRLSEPDRPQAAPVPAEMLDPDFIGGQGQQLQRPTAADQTASIRQTGTAVWNRLKGRTASGERADPNGLTAGHRTLPFGTRVKVVNTLNGRSVSVRINDHGPKQGRFLIDLSRAAARALNFDGTAPVTLVVEQVGPSVQRRRP